MFFLLNVKIIKNALKLNTLSFILYKIGEKIIRVGKMATKDISSEKNIKTKGWLNAIPFIVVD